MFLVIVLLPAAHICSTNTSRIVAKAPKYFRPSCSQLPCKAIQRGRGAGKLPSLAVQRESSQTDGPDIAVRLFCTSSGAQTLFQHVAHHTRLRCLAHASLAQVNPGPAQMATTICTLGRAQNPWRTCRGSLQLSSRDDNSPGANLGWVTLL